MAMPNNTDSAMSETLLTEDQRDCLREVTNIAMGQAGDRLARLLDVFVQLSIPRVNVLGPTDIAMTLQSLHHQGETDRSAFGVCQGFIGGGVAGEVMMLFNDTDFDDLARLLDYEPSQDQNTHYELLMDTANVLNGACLKSLAEQLDTHFSIGPPLLLGEHFDIAGLLQSDALSWHEALVVELNYTIEDHRINCDLLLVIAEDAIAGLIEKLNYLID